MAEHIHLGQWGEEVACKYLKNKGYTVLDRNFRRKWGEIDIVCSVPRGTMDVGDVSRTPSVEIAKESGTLIDWFKDIFNPKKENLRKTDVDKDNKIVFIEVKTLRSAEGIRPEDNITRSKQRKLIKSCQLYISQKKLPINTNWQIDVVGVLLDKNRSKAKINHIKQAVYFN